MMKKLSSLKTINVIMVALLATIWTSCKVEKSGSFNNEQVKDISGTWKINSATVNGIDLKTLVPQAVNDFRIKFEGGNKFTLVNPIPFLAVKNGSYSFDDPLTPLKITLTGDGSAPASTAFDYPIADGKRFILLSFSPGCSLNSYTYKLEKVD